MTKTEALQDLDRQIEIVKKDIEDSKGWDDPEEVRKGRENYLTVLINLRKEVEKESE